MLQGELVGDEVQDAAKVSGSSAIEPDDRGKNSAIVPVLVESFLPSFPQLSGEYKSKLKFVEFRFNGSPLDWRGAV